MKGKRQNPGATSYIQRCQQSSTNIFEFQFDVRFKILMAMPTNIMVFWDVIPFSLADRYQYFRGMAVSIYKTEDFSFFLTMTGLYFYTTHYVLCLRISHHLVLIKEHNVLE